MRIYCGIVFMVPLFLMFYGTTEGIEITTNYIYQCFPGKTLGSRIFVDLVDAFAECPDLRGNKKILYIPDWYTIPAQDSHTDNVVLGLIRNGRAPWILDHNSIWVSIFGALARDYSTEDKELLITYCNRIGVQVGTELHNLGIDFTGFSVVTHGYGVQILTSIVKTLNSFARATGGDKLLGRVTALNPKGEESAYKFARFVNVIQTAYVPSIRRHLGDLIYYPNFPDIVQPGCDGSPTTSSREVSRKSGVLSKTAAISPEQCTHERALVYYIESLVDGNKLYACRHITKYMLGTCHDEVALMGYFAPVGRKGRYALTTNSQSPFGKGESGLNMRQGATFSVSRIPAALFDTESYSEADISYFYELYKKKHETSHFEIDKDDVQFVDLLPPYDEQSFKADLDSVIFYFPDIGHRHDDPTVTKLVQAILRHTKKVPIVFNYASMYKENEECERHENGEHGDHEHENGDSGGREDEKNKDEDDVDDDTRKKMVKRDSSLLKNADGNRISGGNKFKATKNNNDNDDGNDDDEDDENKHKEGGNKDNNKNKVEDDEDEDKHKEGLNKDKDKNKEGDDDDEEDVENHKEEGHKDKDTHKGGDNKDKDKNKEDGDDDDKDGEEHKEENMDKHKVEAGKDKDKNKEEGDDDDEENVEKQRGGRKEQGDKNEKDKDKEDENKYEEEEDDYREEEHGYVSPYISTTAGIQIGLDNFYIPFAKQMPFMGFTTAITMAYMNIKNIHFIGHGMGVHIATKVAEFYSIIAHKSIKRLSALDPLKIPQEPMHSYERSRKLRLNETIDFVDVIHSNPGFIGYEQPVGTVDFYPNFPENIQPKCNKGNNYVKKLVCSHNLAVDYFTESIYDGDNFEACDNVFAYYLDQCPQRAILRSTGQPIAKMGYHVKTSSSGDYFLSTGAKPKYGLEGEGLLHRGPFPPIDQMPNAIFDDVSPVHCHFHESKHDKDKVILKSIKSIKKSKLPKYITEHHKEHFTARKNFVIYFSDLKYEGPKDTRSVQGNQDEENFIEGVFHRDAYPITFDYLTEHPPLQMKDLVKFDKEKTKFNPTEKYSELILALPSTCFMIAAYLSRFPDTVIESSRFVGFGIGAHVLFETAKMYHKLTGKKFLHITALDPTRIRLSPIFGANNYNVLFVDVVHTNPGLLGYPIRAGTLDFFPNFPNSIQPGCESDDIYAASYCSHNKALEFYIDSMKNPGRYPVCLSFANDDADNIPIDFKYLLDGCKKDNALVTYMGYDVSLADSGMALLKTTPKSEEEHHHHQETIPKPGEEHHHQHETKPEEEEQHGHPPMEQIYIPAFSDIYKSAKKISYQCYASDDNSEEPSKIVSIDANKLLGPNDPREIIDECFGTQKKIYIYFPDWRDHHYRTDPSVSAILEGLLKRNHQPIVVNYRKMVGKVNKQIPCDVTKVELMETDDYKDAVKRVPEIAYLLTETFINILKQGFDLSSIHFIGYGFGAHIAAGICRSLSKKHPENDIKRITALDPAGPGFHGKSWALNNEDAEFIDSIYTNQQLYGSLHSVGHAQFFVNPSKIQAGCEDFYDGKCLEKREKCSHQRAWAYYAESITSPKAFPGCNRLLAFLLEGCEPSNMPKYMGYGAKTSTRGKYYLRTNSRPPYGLGTLNKYSLLRRNHQPIVVNYRRMVGKVNKQIPCDVTKEELMETDDYEKAVKRVPEIAYLLTETFINILKQGFDLSSIHFIGYGFGAHIAAGICRSLSKKHPENGIKRITALDPAGPGFHGKSWALNNEDAEFIDSIYTNQQLYGSIHSVGHAQFFVNPSKIQAGCEYFYDGKCLEKREKCSHQRAWAYYAESITSPKAFPGCNRLLAFLLEGCEPSNMPKYMGYGAKTSTRGKYYLRTNSRPPYGLGTLNKYSKTSFNASSINADST